MALFEFKSKIFHSKVARRIVLLFLVSAIVPVILTALLSMGTLSNVLTENNEAQLRRESKLYGMMILSRLQIVESKLKSLAILISDKDLGISDVGSTFQDETLQVFYFDGKFKRQQIYGKARQIPEGLARGELLTITDKSQLVSIRETNTVRIFLLKPVGHLSKDGYVVAELNNRYLWGKEEDLPYNMSVCVFVQNGLYLNCTSNKKISDPGKVIPVGNGNRYFEFSYGDEDYIGTSWDLFLKSRFVSPTWRISIIQNRNSMAHPARLILNYYPLVIGLSLLVVFLLSVNLIRRNLVPLERLLAGTKRIANREYGEQVIVDSRDEFNELADSFNMMSNRIECQVKALTILTEIDKIILSNPDSEYLYSRVVQFISQFLKCNLCSVFTVGLDNEDTQNEYIAFDEGHYSRNQFRNSKIKDELTAIRFDVKYLEVKVNDTGYGFLKNYVLRNISKAYILPVRFRDEVPAVLVVGVNEGQTLNENEMQFLSEISTRLSVAIATEEREKELYYHSHYDLLTSLPNRYFLTQRLQQQIDQARRNDTRLAVLFIDLDRFKNINDSLGHSIGDKLLISAAERLNECVRETDLVCRLGGDEFTVVLSNVIDKDNVSIIAEKIIAELARKFHVDDQELFVSASIGISIFPDDGQTSEELLKNADTAMYRAKQNGRAHHQYYMEYMNREEIERSNMERELRSAIDSNQLVLMYQPLVNLKSGRVTGAEALLRWDHPERGLISASEFISLAEETGLIDQLGLWVLDQACHQFVNWTSEGIVLDRVAVNVSGRQFASGNFPAMLIDIMNRAGMSGENLEIEITENLLLDDRCGLKSIIDELHKLGVQFSIDDFGTGYSSLSYLKQFPVDTLKVDRRFLKDVPFSDDACAIVRTIVMMAHTLKMKVIAEGIENTRQLDFLKSIKCNVGQGFYYHTPLSAEKFAEFCLQFEHKPKIISA